MLVADRSPVYRRGLAALLAERPGWRVAAETGDAEQAAALAVEERPDVALVDLDLPGAAELCARLRVARPGLPVVVTLDSEERPELGAAVRAGARGYLRRDAPLEQVQATIAGAAQGRALLAPSVATRLLDEFAVLLRRGEAGGRSTLSAREIEVLALVAEGLSNGAVAERLYISESTVKNHMRSIHDKLAVHTRTEAVTRAIKEGLLDPPT